MPPKNDDNVSVRVFMPVWLRDAFKQMTEEQYTSMNAWMCKTILEAVTKEGYGRPPDQPYESFADLVSYHKMRLRNKIQETALQAYENGCKPTPLDLVRIAACLDLPEEFLVDLCNRSTFRQDDRPDENTSLLLSGTTPTIYN